MSFKLRSFLHLFAVLLHLIIYKPSYSRFCPKFRCHGNRGWSWSNLSGIIQLARPGKPPVMRKDLEDISYKS